MGKGASGRLRMVQVDQEGFTYLGVLIALAMLGTNLALAGVMWHFAQQRVKESDLLFIGNQFRTAIGRYYLNQLGPQKEYPKKLEDLLRDPRHPGTVHYLRKLYTDPMTGSKDWGLLKTPDGSILGVYSKSDRTPIKQANFGPSGRNLEHKSKYSEWKFVYLPGQPLGNTAASQSPGQNSLDSPITSPRVQNAERPQSDLFGTLATVEPQALPNADPRTR